MIDRFKGKYGFLSNFYWHDGWTVEHLFQAAKATNEKDRLYVLAADSPNEAKRRGRKIKCREDWEEGHKEKVMLELSRLKYAIPEMRKKLLETEDEELIEGNWWHDNEWGDCTCEKCRHIPGKNKLGKIIMQVRKEISSTS